MCGIVGLLRAPGMARGELSARAAAMAATIAHRGPDDDGVWTNETAGVAFGHRRLAIIDLSPHGSQPMVAAGGQYVICYNGEIYNHLELRDELAALGVTFRGTSDTETLLEAIACWGLETALSKANGMFAFALWDDARRLLHLCRDRLGQKPLYYGWAGRTFLFASELKALQTHPDFAASIDRDALSAFLRHGYVPAPHTIYRNVSKLPAGTLLSIGRDEVRDRNAPEPRPYWSAITAAQRGGANRVEGSDAELIEQLQALLSDAVGKCMIADVPLGAFLSGGIDSSTIVALMQAQSTAPVRTFSIGFAEEGYSEAKDAAAVAQHLGTDHTELYVTSADAQAVIPDLPRMYDEPFADSSQIPTFLVSRLARRHVTVSLSGDGGDELFAGYSRYGWASRINRTYKLAPFAARRLMCRAITSVSPTHWDALNSAAARAIPRRFRHGQLGDKLHKLAAVIEAPGREAMYRRLVSQWPEPCQIARHAGESETILSNPDRWPTLQGFTQQMMLLDTLMYLPDDILVKVDRATMAVSLEGRVPFLDHRVMEFAWRLPQRLKLRDRTTKWILREILARHLPRDMFTRPKMGFGVPIGDWLRGDLRDWAESLLTPARLKDGGYFDTSILSRVWQEHLSSVRNWQYQLWTILMFEAWRENTGAS